MSDLNFDKLLSVSKAVELIDSIKVHLSTEPISINSCDLIDRVLAEEVKSDRDYPPFDRALMDGFAMRSEDGQANRVIMGEIAAGGESSRKLLHNDCIAIMTGAPVPESADCVVPIEQTTRIDDRQIAISITPKKGQSISCRGADCKAGATLLRPGTRLTPAVLGVLATVGQSKIAVYKKPTVGVLSTGDEIVSIDSTPVGSQIRNSNNILLRSFLKKLGIDASDLGHVVDDRQLIRQKIESADVDVLLVTGGMSMGEYDFVPKVMHELGYQLPITKLKIKPGKPFVMGLGDKQPRYIFGLPGNPVSAFVCTVRLVSRMIRKLQGLDPEGAWQPVVLENDIPPAGPREFYQPCRVVNGRATVFSWKGSADLFTLSQANALVMRPENDIARYAGETVQILEIPS